MTFKKFLIILACVLAAVILIAVAVPYEEIQDSVTFYYPRAQFLYGAPEGIMGSEQRQVGEHEGDLDYLLALYLEGPMDSSLAMPFPGHSRTRILTVKQNANTLNILLNDLSTAMTDSEFTLACACLSKTCLGLTDARAVTITSGERSLRLTPENMILFDESTSVDTKETEETK